MIWLCNNQTAKESGMVKKAPTHKLLSLCALSALAVLSSQALASDFNLPFVSAAEIGNVFAGWAATANDASATYANPAGLIRIQNQQLVLSATGVYGNSHFNGITTPPFPPSPPQVGYASTFLYKITPQLYYSAPLSDRVVLGFGESAPFAIGTDYPKMSVVRYSATTSQIVAIDLTPSIGVAVTKKFAVGFGFDAARLALTFNRMYGPPSSIPDSETQNHLTGWGYGYHAGLLYQFTPATRAGITYYSHLVFNPTGDSEIFGPGAFGGEIRTTNQKTDITLPARINLSAYHDFCKRWAVMGSVFYTNWSVLDHLTLKNSVIPGGGIIPITVSVNYHNTFDYAAALNFRPTSKWTLKSGIEFLQTPTNERNRLIADPFNVGTAIGVGVHYQQNHSIGYDAGYTHVFFQELKYNNITANNSVFGYSHTNVNTFGAQITWNFT